MDDEKLLRRIRGQDLFACEAQFHKSCRAKYVQDSNRRSTNTQECESQGDLQKAHYDTYNAITGIVDKEIFLEGKIPKLSDLCNMYIDLLQNTRYANPSYRSSKLKAKREKFYGDKLSFCEPVRFNTYLVFNSNISMDFVIRQAYTLGLQDILTDSATSLHEEMNNTWKSAPELKWPPTVNDLASMDGNSPPKLLKFLSILIDW